MILTDEEMVFVKELYAQKIKQEQIEIIETEMWNKVGKASGWGEVIEIKREYREAIDNA